MKCFSTDLPYLFTIITYTMGYIYFLCGIAFNLIFYYYGESDLDVVTVAMYVQSGINIVVFLFAFFYTWYYLSRDPPSLEINLDPANVFTTSLIFCLIYLDIIVLLVTSLPALTFILQLFLDFFGYGYQYLLLVTAFPRQNRSIRERMEDKTMRTSPRIWITLQSLFVLLQTLYYLCVFVVNINIQIKQSSELFYAFLVTATENLLLFCLLNSSFQKWSSLRRDGISFLIEGAFRET